MKLLRGNELITIQETVMIEINDVSARRRIGRLGLPLRDVGPLQLILKSGDFGVL